MYVLYTLRAQRTGRKEGQFKDSETYQCHNLIPENQDISYQNGQREIIQKSSKENESKEVSLAESKKNGGSTSKRDPTEWELQNHTDAESIRRLGYLHGGLPSKDFKSGHSMAKNPNSSKCENVWVQSEYVRDTHCLHEIVWTQKMIAFWIKKI